MRRNKMSRREYAIEVLRGACRSWNTVTYIGQKFIGNYGRITENSDYSELRAATGAASFNNNNIVRHDDALLVLDRGAYHFSRNLYDNGRGNLYWLDEDNSEIWPYYFNLEDSNIIKTYIRKFGLRRIDVSCKESLFEVINIHKLGIQFQKYIINNDVLINGEVKNFSKWKEFIKYINSFGNSYTTETVDIKTSSCEMEITLWNVCGWWFPEITYMMKK